jgi:hypothetical protein
MSFSPVHDFYSSHVHPVPGHLASSGHPNATSPPLSHSAHLHQIHNPTPSYYHHHSPTSLGLEHPNKFLSANNNSSALVSGNYPLSSNQQSQALIAGSESPTAGDHYGANIQLPPTPNSMVTMNGPTSGKRFKERRIENLKLSNGLFYHR